MEKGVIFLNPSAKDWSAQDQWPKLEELLQKYRVPFDLVETEKERESTVEKVSKIMRQGYSWAAGVGGDGTQNQIINGIMREYKNKPLDHRPTYGIVPYGTANDLARSFNITPGDIERSVRTLAAQETNHLDLGLVDDGTYFADSFSVGISAEILKDRNEHKKGRILFAKGIGSYFPSILNQLFKYRSITAQLRFPDCRQEEIVYDLIIKNCSVFGGSFILSDQISANDGKLDAFLFRHGDAYLSEISTQVLSSALDHIDIVDKFTQGKVQLRKAGRLARVLGWSMDRLQTYLGNREERKPLTENQDSIRTYEGKQFQSLVVTLNRPAISQLDGDTYRISNKYKIKSVEKALRVKTPPIG